MEAAVSVVALLYTVQTTAAVVLIVVVYCFRVVVVVRIQQIPVVVQQHVVAPPGRCRCNQCMLVFKQHVIMIFCDVCMYVCAGINM